MTSCSNIQLLEPDVPDVLSIDADNHSLAVEEGGIFALAINQLVYPVVFEQEKLSSDYDFIESDITNTVDGSPLSIGPTFTERTSLGYILTLDAYPDTANYFWRWRVRVTAL